MNNKEFTDELFQRMYELGYERAEIENGTIFFYEHERYAIGPFLPRVPVKCTCFEERNQLIDIAEYLGVVDWSKVKVDTPVIVWNRPENGYFKRHFAKYEKERIYVWGSGATSWSDDGCNGFYAWENAKLAEG